jgi:hypothetical protein
MTRSLNELRPASNVYTCAYIMTPNAHMSRAGVHVPSNMKQDLVNFRSSLSIATIDQHVRLHTSLHTHACFSWHAGHAPQQRANGTWRMGLAWTRHGTYGNSPSCNISGDEYANVPEENDQLLHWWATLKHSSDAEVLRCWFQYHFAHSVVIRFAFGPQFPRTQSR